MNTLTVNNRIKNRESNKTKSDLFQPEYGLIQLRYSLLHIIMHEHCIVAIICIQITMVQDTSQHVYLCAWACVCITLIPLDEF